MNLGCWQATRRAKLCATPWRHGAQGRANPSCITRSTQKPWIYVETTIPSFYHTTRTSMAARARRAWTRRWWRLARCRYELVTSGAVLGELREGNYPSREAALALALTLPILGLSEVVRDIAEQYIKNHLMPAGPSGDALHLAFASYNQCKFLVTWNCRHLANANKFGHLRRISSRLGLHVPVLTTPLELLGESEHEPAE